MNQLCVVVVTGHSMTSKRVTTYQQIIVWILVSVRI